MDQKNTIWGINIFQGKWTYAHDYDLIGGEPYNMCVHSIWTPQLVMHAHLLSTSFEKRPVRYVEVKYDMVTHIDKYKTKPT